MASCNLQRIKRQRRRQKNDRLLRIVTRHYVPHAGYYGSKHRCYINSKLLDEQGCIGYICSEITRSGCLYLYRLDGEKEHAHTIAEVFLSPYNDAACFSIDAEDEEFYNNQELSLIQNLVKQGMQDRRSQCL